jgi:hypothetical protein
MRNVFHALIPALAATLVLLSPVTAAEDAGPTDEASRLDKLFADLKRERNERAAERIANQIWVEWRKSGSASVDLILQWSNEAAETKKFDVALDFLDQAGTGAPPCIS